MVAGLQPRAGHVDTYRASGARRLEVLLNDMLMQRAELLRAIELRLAKPGREAAPVVLLLNVDRFEVINDNLGPLVGQHALELIRRRIQTCLRRSDMLARLRGDEFGLLLGRRTRMVEATILAERIADALRAPLSIGGHQLTLTVSIGIASGEGETSPVQVLRNADIAMCQAKAAGRARYSVFDPHMRHRAWERMRLETDLRRALVDDEFVVHYQPIVDLASSEPVGHEALVRWQHHKRGLVPPSEFIPVAEDNGLIVPIGRLVLINACAQAAGWRRTGAQPLAVSVNLSARQLERSEELIGSVREALATSQLDPGLLKLEITESAVMRDPEPAIATLWSLKGLGVKLAVDDFGTGYSSMAYLKRFPIDTLKIDRSFIDGIAHLLEDRAIVGATIAFARALGMTVVAEGVESDEQAAVLRDLGCDLGQGYLWGKPAPMLLEPLARAA
jgi:diguanylate cyclase (GGDEF)-like protein